MAKTSLDKQLEQAEARVKRLKQRKAIADLKAQVKDAQADAKNARAEAISNLRIYKDLFADVRQLFDDVQKGHVKSVPVTFEDKQTVDMLRKAEIVKRLDDIIKKQP